MDNSSVIEIVVQIQIRLGNSARTVALRRATAKIPNCLIGIVEGRKFPKHDLYLGTDGYYVNKMLHTASCQR